MTKGVRGVRSPRMKPGKSVPKNPYRSLKVSPSKVFSPKEPWEVRKARLKKERKEQDG